MTEAGAVNEQLVALLEIQDLRSKARELRGEGELEALEQEHFNIDPAEATAQLEERIVALEAELEPRIRSRYGRVKDTFDRVVVPVINGVCYGCFVSIATAVARDQDPNEAVRSCETCGRFIYILS